VHTLPRPPPAPWGHAAAAAATGRLQHLLHPYVHKHQSLLLLLLLLHPDAHKHQSLLLLLLLHPDVHEHQNLLLLLLPLLLIRFTPEAMLSPGPMPQPACCGCPMQDPLHGGVTRIGIGLSSCSSIPLLSHCCCSEAAKTSRACPDDACMPSMHHALSDSWALHGPWTPCLAPCGWPPCWFQGLGFAGSQAPPGKLCGSCSKRVVNRRVPCPGDEGSSFGAEEWLGFRDAGTLNSSVASADVSSATPD